MTKTALVIQGGGFRTAFTAGVLDAFTVTRWGDFDRYMSVSGGCIALSYYLSGQYGFCFEAMRLMAESPHFVKFSRAMSDAGYMDIDYMERIAKYIMPFNEGAAIKAIEGKDLHFVATLREDASPAYLSPVKGDWVNKIIASSTLPFVTKGKHLIDGHEYFDGGWSDPIPVQKVHEEGARDILVIRTARADARVTQSWPDYFGSIYFKSKKALKGCFENSHHIYNDSLNFLEAHHEGTTIRQIAPERSLKSGTYSYSIDSLTQDYRYGLDLGLQFVNQRRRAGR